MESEQILQELDPELRPHFYQHKLVGPSIAHPLVELKSLHVELPSDAEFSNRAALVNQILKEKREQKQTCLNEKDWHSYVFIHERYARVAALSECIKYNNFELSSLWELVGQVWLDTETAWSNRDQWREIWAEPCPRRWKAMSRAERNTLRRLPDEIEVWRGTSNLSAVLGMSWTLSRDKAEWFANRWSGPDGPILARGRIAKANVCAYFTGRREREIVTLSDDVEVLELLRI